MAGPTRCTRCGANLPMAGGARVCAVCGQFHEPGPPPGRPKQAQMSSRAARAKGGAGVGCLLFLVIGVPIIVAVGAVVIGFRASTGGSGGAGGDDLYPSTGDLLVLPGDLGDDPAVVTMATPVGSSERVVALVELEDGPVWEAPVVPADVYSAQFAATDDVVLASVGRAVIGLDRATGDVLWEGEASDVVTPSCHDCFVLVGGTLVVLGDDGEVTAFDPATGEVRWSHRFESVVGQVVPLEDAVLLVDDQADEPPEAALTMTVVRPEDGSVVTTFRPGCADEAGRGSEYSISATPRLPVIPVPGTDDVVLVYGSSTSCVQRWTATTGEQRWSRLTEARLDWYDAGDVPWALGDTELVLAGYEGWLVVGLAEGGVTTVAAPADTMVDPAVTVAGDRFVGTVSSTRGTTEWSLVAHDLRGGEEAWTHELGPDLAPAIVGPQSSSASVYDTGIFALTSVGDDLRLLTVGPPGPRFEVSTIDPATGEVEIAGVAPVRTDSPTSSSARIDTVRDGQAVVDADGRLQVVDLTTGEVGAAWGR